MPGSNLNFSHLYSKNASSANTTTLVNANPIESFELLVLVPTDLMSTILWFETDSTGPIQLDVLPLKQYLDVLDVKLVDKNVTTFLDDANPQAQVKNLVYYLNTLGASPNDPIQSLPASAIIESAIGDIETDPLFTTVSAGPVDTTGTAPDYSALRTLLSDALQYNMEVQSDGIKKRIIFETEDSLTLRVNFAINKTRRFLLQNGNNLQPSIVINGVTINLNTSIPLNSTSVTYLITFRAINNTISNFISNFGSNTILTDYNATVKNVQLFRQVPIINTYTLGFSKLTVKSRVEDIIAILNNINTKYVEAIQVKNKTVSIASLPIRATYNYMTSLVPATVPSSFITLLSRLTTLLNDINSDPFIYDDSLTIISGVKSTFDGTLPAFPSTVKTIGSNAFDSLAVEIGVLIIPPTITTIGQYAFNNCQTITGNLTIPNTVRTLGNNAFAGCTNITGITLPTNMSTLSNNLFQGCTGINTSLTIPPSVRIISASVFAGCGGFTGNLVIPSGVTSIGTQAFYASGTTGNLVIPNTVTSIGEGAFTASRFDGSLTISSNLTRIRNETFSYCGFTGNLVIPSGVTEIGDYAFTRTKFTGTLTIPSTVRTIGVEAFSSSTLTGSLIIPNGVTTIGAQAFWGCAEFTGSLIIPNSVLSIGTRAFQGYPGTTASLSIPTSVTTIAVGTFSGARGLTGALVIPNNIISINSRAFETCINLTSIVIGNSVTTIGSSAFENCIGLTGNLVIPNSVTSIGPKAFKGCRFLSGDIIARADLSVADDAFDDTDIGYEPYVPPSGTGGTGGTGAGSG
jgi:hypothetical protein